MKKMLLIAVVLTWKVTLFASTIDGFVNLENQSLHCDVKVKFVAVSLTAKTDSTYSDSTGHYSINIQNGIYNIEYAKEGFDRFVSENVLVVQNTTLSTVKLLIGPIKYISGNLNGTLHKDTMYIVNGECVINVKDTLKIEPGTKIKFRGFYSLLINGTIIAKGTDADKIQFTSGMSNPAKGDWNNITFASSCNPNSVFSNCIVEYGGILEEPTVDNRYSMIRVYNSITIDSCIVRESVAHAIYIFDGLSTIADCQVYNNNRGGIYSYQGGLKIQNNIIYNCGWQGIRNNVVNTEIVGNTVYNNDGGIICFNYALIEKNKVFNNKRYGIDLEFCGSSIIRNTIIGNLQAGISMTGSNYVIFNSNVISENKEYGIEFNETCSSTSIKYNLFYGNKLGDINQPPLGVGYRISTNANGTECDAYFNIFENQLFENTFVGDSLFLYLKYISPCINAGDPALSKDEDLSIADIGAIPYYSSKNTVGLTGRKRPSGMYFSSGCLYISDIADVTSVRIINGRGMVVLTKSTDITPLNISELDKGVYVIQLIGKDGIRSSKFIKR